MCHTYNCQPTRTNGSMQCCAWPIYSERSVGTLVCDEKVSVTKNHHFLKLCQEGQLGPPASDEKCLKQKMITFSSCVMAAFEMCSELF